MNKVFISSEILVTTNKMSNLNEFAKTVNLVNFLLHRLNEIEWGTALTSDEHKKIIEELITTIDLVLTASEHMTDRMNILENRIKDLEKPKPRLFLRIKKWFIKNIGN